MTQVTQSGVSASQGKRGGWRGDEVEVGERMVGVNGGGKGLGWGRG